MGIINWVMEHSQALINLVCYTIAAASIIVKLTPTIDDDNLLKAVIKFLGKFIALDKYGPDGKE